MHLTLDDLRGSSPDVGESRPITEDDMAVLRGPKGSVPPPRKKLRYKHHALARSLASGLQESTAAAVTGFAPVTVSILKRDPAFQELMKFYATEEGRGFDHVRAQLLGVGQKFIEELDRRLTKAPDEMTVRDLRETGTVLLDRAGFGPAASQTHDIHIHAGLADALKASRVNAPFPRELLNETVRGAGNETGAVPRVIEGEFEEVRPERRTNFGWDE